MNIIICLDDNQGLLFNNRRQSKDKEVIKKILEIVGESNLFIHSFSRNLFDSKASINDNLLSASSSSDFCFIENLPLAPYKEKIDSIYIFKWNRKYPYDTTIDINIADYILQSTTDFVGSSHEKITLEVYHK